jgi:hypothetical protein
MGTNKRTVCRSGTLTVAYLNLPSIAFRLFSPPEFETMT